MKRLVICCLLVASCARQAEQAQTAPPRPPSATAAPGPLDVTKPPFSARGDGIADDGPAIQRAIRIAVERGRRGSSAVVYLPAGNYRVRGQLELEDNSGSSARGLVVHGDGPASFIGFDHDLQDGEGIGLRGKDAQDLTIRDLRIGAATPGAGFNRGIALRGGSRVVLRNLDISGARVGTHHGKQLGYPSGIFLDGGISEVRILDNDLHDNGTDNGNSWHIVVYGSAGASHVSIRGNRCVTTEKAAYRANFGIGVFDSSYVTVEGNYVEGVVGTRRDADGYGIMLYGTGVGRSHDHVVAKNTIRRTGGAGIYVQASPNTVVAGNLLEDTVRTQSATSLAIGAIGFNSGPGVISSNIVRGVGVLTAALVPPAGIAIQTCGPESACAKQDSAPRGIVVSGNTVEQTAGHGIAIRAAPSMAAHNSTITGNTLTSTRGGIGTIGGSPVRGLVIVGNTIARGRSANSDSAPGIHLFAVEDSVVANNVVLDAAGQGIVLQQAKRNVVEGNLVRASSTGIEVSGAYNLIVGNSTGNAPGVSGRWGIAESGASNRILGNLVGTDPAVPGILSSGIKTLRANNGPSDETPGSRKNP